MYLIIRLAQHLDTPNIVDGRWVSKSDVSVEETDELISINPDDYPNIFKKNPDNAVFGYDFSLIEGFDNAPKYVWNSETRTFSSYTGFEEDSRVKSYKRREELIQPDILYTIRPGTEFKKIRKCLQAIIDAIPALKDLPEVQEFIAYSLAINKLIARYPKNKE